MRRWIEEQFFKVRYLYVVEKGEAAAEPPGDPRFDIFRLEREQTPAARYEAARYEAARYEAPRYEAAQFLAEYFPPRRLERRLKHPQIDVFVAFAAESGAPLGYTWTLWSGAAETWHDKFPLPPGTGLVFNNFVLPAHRRQGVNFLAQQRANSFLLHERGCERVYSLVESANLPSRRAHEKLGAKTAALNYLVKFLRRDLLSIYRSPSGWRVYSVLSHDRRFRF